MIRVYIGCNENGLARLNGAGRTALTIEESNHLIHTHPVKPDAQMVRRTDGGPYSTEDTGRKPLEERFEKPKGLQHGTPRA